ncbi:2Fe-2S iron-sulfur cluster-binding protein [Mycobacterium interjectum]|uniref:2Fe-2S iron-sulfur cluster-binding protein n=1 Tax=Mycobacterium interjectum TaxID=33895 RepID=UPI0021F293C1|nr:2Fe-2S iron-sulfur cluster binding domain-containing protein [Mycobacterium interjectum]MCV7088724.1 2Fe-2S iron-sulfur cluster binding domain-containing protein [Mycobacterium interjectum]
MSKVAHADVDLDGRRYQLRWPARQSLVDAMLDAGIDVPHACREGRRGSCARRSDPVVPVPAGSADLRVEF